MRSLNEIGADIRRLDRSSAESVWEIGKLLQEAKLNTPHGQYTEWVLRELKFSLSYANRLSRLYSEYSDGLPEGFAISTLLCTLPLEDDLRAIVNDVVLEAELTKAEAEALVAEARRDREAVNEMRARLEAAKQDPLDLERVRAEIREEVRAELQATAKQSRKKEAPDADPAEVEALRSEVAELRKSESEWRAGVALRAAEREAEADRLKDAAVSAQREAESVRAELQLARAEIASLSAKSAPVEVRVEVPPADYDEARELAAQVPALRRAIANMEASGANSKTPANIEHVVEELRWRRKYCAYLLQNVADPESVLDFDTFREEFVSFGELIVHE